MNSEFSISRTNLESLLKDDWLMSLISPKGEIDTVTLGIPDTVPVTIIYKEVAN
jgi:hypothetical protein